MCAIIVGCSTQSPESAATTSAPAGESPDLLQRAKDRAAKGDTTGAIETYTQFLQRDPGNIAALGNRAALLVAAHRYEQALADYNQLLQFDAQNYAAYDRRAELHDKMGQYSLALEDLQLIESHRENDPDLLNRIADTHLKLAQYPQALNAVNRALQLRRGWPVGIRTRAAIYYAMQDFNHAEQDYIYLLEQNPKDSEALNGEGMIAQFRDGDLLQAERHYREAVLHNPYNASAWYNIGYLEAGQGKVDQAKRNFGEAIRCDDSYADAYVNRGLLYMRDKQHALALHDFEQALALQPSNMHTKLLRGWARCASGDRTPGCIDLADAKAAHEPGVETLIDQYCK